MSCLNESAEKKTLNWGLLRATQGLDYHALTHQCPSSLPVWNERERFSPSSPRRGNKLEHASSVPAFQGNSFCLAYLGTLWDLAYSTCLGGTENKRELGGVLLLQNTYNTADTGQCSSAASPLGQGEGGRQ